MNDFPSRIDESEQAAVNEWTKYGMKLAVSAALHPFEYAKVLIQVSGILKC
jgi:mitochondrial carrier